PDLDVLLQAAVGHGEAGDAQVHVHRAPGVAPGGKTGGGDHGVDHHKAGGAAVLDGHILQLHAGAGLALRLGGGVDVDAVLGVLVTHDGQVPDHDLAGGGAHDAVGELLAPALGGDDAESAAVQGDAARYGDHGL